MITRVYTLQESADSLRFMWSTPEFPPALRLFFLAVLLLAPLSFFFRARLGRRFASLWGPLGNPLLWGLMGPLLSMTSLATLMLWKDPQVVVSWVMNAEGFQLTSRNGRVEGRWGDVIAVERDERAGDRERAAWVVRSKNGAAAWFIMTWLDDEHREKLQRRILNSIPEGTPRPEN